MPKAKFKLVYIGTVDTGAVPPAALAEAVQANEKRADFADWSVWDVFDPELESIEVLED